MIISLPKTLKTRSLWKLFFLILLGAVFFCIPKEYWGESYPICLYKILFNKQCVGCGTTRAIWSILHLRFHDALEYNKLIVVTFPLLAGCLLHWAIPAPLVKKARP